MVPININGVSFHASGSLTYREILAMFGPESDHTTTVNGRSVAGPGLDETVQSGDEIVVAQNAALDG